MKAEKEKIFLSIDIGASSGRHILVRFRDGRLSAKEIYRFQNGPVLKEGHLVWEIERLFDEVINGMKVCASLGEIPCSCAIDTWGVDYVLLDENGNRLGDCISYRDARTERCGAQKSVFSKIPEEELYQKTGIANQPFNTIYQLAADQMERPEQLTSAKHLLMVPDYLNYLLTGVMAQEYTNASTTGLLNAQSRCFDREIIRRLGYPQQLFKKLTAPGTRIGTLRPEIAARVGFDVPVFSAASHDTASAVMSVPSDKKHTLYLSSGTWSLLGCELFEPDCTPEAEKAGFTNEGGYQRRIRFLKNIMGLWMIQSVKKEAEAARGEEISFGTLCDDASKEKISSLIDAEDDRFLSPDSMSREVRSACRESGQRVPQSAEELAAVIYRSLAHSYQSSINELEALCGKSFDTLYIIGGGSNARWLNQLTADACKKTICAGPSEATAIGNAGAQMLADGVFSSLEEFRRAVRDSFSCEIYQPDQKKEGNHHE